MKNDGVIMASGLQGFRARDNIADSLRGFTIILMVFAHIALWFESTGIVLERHIAFSKWIYSFHMPLLFVVSGYVHAIKQLNISDCLPQIKKCFIDIYLPCLWFSFPQWFIMWFIFPSYNPANFGAATIEDLYMIFLTGFKEYWFLAALFFVKALHIVLECRIKNTKLISVIFITLFILISFFQMPVFISRLSYGLYFHIGYLIKRTGYINKDNSRRCLYGIILLGAGTLMYLFPYNYNLKHIYTSVRVISLCLAWFIIFYSLGISSSFLNAYGIYSMVVYCSHNYAAASLRLLYKVLGLSEYVSNIFFLYFCFIMAMAIPMLIVWIYKNLRCFRWIEYIFYPGKLLLKK